MQLAWKHATFLLFALQCATLAFCPLPHSVNPTCTFDLCVAIKKWIVAFSTGKMVTPRPSFCCSCCRWGSVRVWVFECGCVYVCVARAARNAQPFFAYAKNAFCVSFWSASVAVALIWKKFCAYLLKNSWRVLLHASCCLMPDALCLMPASCCLLSVGCWQKACGLASCPACPSGLKSRRRWAVTHKTQFMHRPGLS